MKSKLALLFNILVFAVCTAKGETLSSVFKYFKYEGKGIPAVQAALPAVNNPIIPGWASDPSICRVGEDYWLVTSTFGYFPAVPLYHSRDLIHWELVRNIIDRKSQLPNCFDTGARSLDRGGIYAPTIRYNEQNKTYYMITTDVTGMNSASKGGHFYVTAKNPRGEWSDAVRLPDIDGIDPSFFFDTDGKAYIVYKEDVEGQPKWSNHRAIRIIRFDTETGNTIGESMPFKEEGVGPEERLGRNEGPHIYKVGKAYIMVCAEGGTGIHHSAVCYKADNVMGPYRRWARNPMLTQRYLKPERPYAVTCAGHADLVETPEGKWYAVFLGMRSQVAPLFGTGKESADLGRETFLMPVQWSEDGFPYIIQEKDTIPNHSRPLSWQDDFSGKMPRPEWLSAPGIPGYQGIRLQHHCFEAEVQVLPATANAHQHDAGIMLLKNEDRQYRFLTDGHTLTLLRIGKKGRQETIASRSIVKKDKPLALKVASDGFELHFSYAESEGSETLLGTAPISFLSTTRSGGFTGITVGVYANKKQAARVSGSY